MLSGITLRSSGLRVGLLTLCIVGWGACSPLRAAEPTPVGVWKTYDDKTGAARAVVRLFEQQGRLFGKIEQSFKPGAERRTCTVCSDERKDQPILGLVIVRNLVRDGDEYSGGDILDPETGSVYRCKLRLEGNGTRLVVRGYIGFSLLGRSQVWQRQQQ